MLTIQLAAGFRGRDAARCEWEGREFTARHRTPAREIARLLVRAGCGDVPYEIARGGVVVQAGASLYELGGLGPGGQIATVEANTKLPSVPHDAAKLARIEAAREAAAIFLR